MTIKIENNIIGENEPVFIIAELSANHNQKFDLAIKTIEAAERAGADAIKMQTYTPDTLTINCDNEYFKINNGSIWDGKTLYDLYSEAYTPWEWQPKLKKVADDLGLICFSSPFDVTSVDFLEQMNVPAYKLASFEIFDLELIRYVASKDKPVIISTGMATLADIELAVETCREVGNNQIALLKCTSSYPAPIEDANLLTIPNMKATFNTIVGLSDHSISNNVAIASIALGAQIIEKHFILDKSIKSPDSQFSLDPKQFEKMVQSIREVELAMGRVNYSMNSNQLKSKKFSRSLFVVEDIKKGDYFSSDNVKVIRPGDGLHPKFLKEIIGKKTKRDISKGTPVSWDLLLG